MNGSRSPAVALWPLHRLWGVTAAAFVLLVLWDASGMDMALAGLTGGPEGFRWRSAPWALAAHEGTRYASGAALLWLLLSIAWPTGVLRGLPRPARIWLLIVTITAMLGIAALKQASQVSCPWDLRAFGGVARHVSHWRWGVSDGGPGGCFPGGHASAGFAFVSGYFALRPYSLATAQRWLVLALVAGTALGLLQQLRGAHFASHTFWTAALCWLTALACASVFPPGGRDAPAAG